MRIVAGIIIAQKYKIEAPLARGGMGAVWVARHVQLGSQLALKFLDPRLAVSPSFVQRFEREARAAAGIQSPHVVQVQDIGVHEGVPFLVMELLRGEDLRSRLRRVGRLSMAETAGMLVQVGKGLRRAHEAGIVHRDIKPGNLFLASIDGDEVLKVLDFGIAKEPHSSIGDATQTGEIVGSPHYVSPEQARGDKDVDHRSDVWSVGVIAYRMITGQLPFPGDGMGQVLSKLLTQPPPPVKSIVPDLPASLDVFFARALAKDREERFQTVRALVDAYMPLLRNEAPEDSISPPSWSSIRAMSLPEMPAASAAIPGPAPLPTFAPGMTTSPAHTTVPTPATALLPSADTAPESAATVLEKAARAVPAPALAGERAVSTSHVVTPGLSIGQRMTAKEPSDPPPPSSSGFGALTPSVVPRLRPHHSQRRMGLGIAVGTAVLATGGALLWAIRPVTPPVEASAPSLPEAPAHPPTMAPPAAPPPPATPTFVPPALASPRSAAPASSSARPPYRLPGSAVPYPPPAPPGSFLPVPQATPGGSVLPYPPPAPTGSSPRAKWGL